jgi:hypothetical protein
MQALVNAQHNGIRTYPSPSNELADLPLETAGLAGRSHRLSTEIPMKKSSLNHLRAKVLVDQYQRLVSSTSIVRGLSEPITHNSNAI